MLELRSIRIESQSEINVPSYILSKNSRPSFHSRLARRKITILTNQIPRFIIFLPLLLIRQYRVRERYRLEFLLAKFLLVIGKGRLFVGVVSEAFFVVRLAEFGGRCILGNADDGFVEAGSFAVGFGEDGGGGHDVRVFSVQVGSGFR